MKYDNDICNRFVEDMLAENLEPYHYEGRYGSTFPAVNVDLDDLHYIMSITDVIVQYEVLESRGNGIDRIVVYPGVSGQLEDT